MQHYVTNWYLPGHKEVGQQGYDLGLNNTQSEVEPNFKNSFDTIPKPFRYGPEKCVDLAFERMSFKRDADPVWSMRKGDNSQRCRRLVRVLE